MILSIGLCPAVIKPEGGSELTIEENKEFLLLNDELLAAHEFLHGKRIQPTGELVCYPPMPSRERIAAAINWLFEADARGKTNEISRSRLTVRVGTMSHLSANRVWT
jgi:hypothetical protein